jgi:serine/threonine protein kinase
MTLSRRANSRSGWSRHERRAATQRARARGGGRTAPWKCSPRSDHSAWSAPRSDRDPANGLYVNSAQDERPRISYSPRWERKGYRLDALEVAQLIYQLLDVLRAAHAKGIVHRDVKPENLFLTHERVLRVLDFGVARFLDGSITATRSGGILGTLAFISPEQVLGKTREVDARSDLWSVGATAFTLLSGRYVHEAETPEEMMVFAGSRPARSLATLESDVPFPLVRVFDRALMFDKSERWSDARAMQRALASAYRDAFGATMPGHDVVDDEEAGDKTTVDHEEAEDKTTIMPETTDDGAEPLSDTSSVAVTVSEPVHLESLPTDGPSSVPAALPMRRSTIDGVVATTTDDIPTLAAPQTRAKARPSMRLLVLAAVGVLVAITGSLLVVIAKRHESTAASAVPITREAPAILPTTSRKVEAWAVLSSAQTATIEPPTFAVEELPTTPPTTPPSMNVAAKPSALPSSIPARLPAASAAPPPVVVATPKLNANCTPPFAVDPLTGMKKWKLECL